MTTTTTTNTNAAITAAKEDGISFATKAELISALEADGFTLARISSPFLVEGAHNSLSNGFIHTQRGSYQVTSGVLRTKSRNLASYHGGKVTLVVLAMTRNGGQELLIKKE